MSHRCLSGWLQYPGIFTIFHPQQNLKISEQNFRVFLSFMHVLISPCGSHFHDELWSFTSWYVYPVWHILLAGVKCPSVPACSCFIFTSTFKKFSVPYGNGIHICNFSHIFLQCLAFPYISTSLSMVKNNFNFSEHPTKSCSFKRWFSW